MIDKEIKELVSAEKIRQKRVINLIASENYVSKEVLRILGSELVNKYAEGYPGRRYYGGNEIMDKIERLARRRALKLFGLNPKRWAVNVQPLSGSPANLAVYSALLKPHSKIMGMSLDHGGHLTHAQPVSLTGRLWQQIPYGVDVKTGFLDYDRLRALARVKKPDLVVAGFTAYSQKINFKKFRQVADSADSLLMVDMSHFAGLVAGGVYPRPFAYADVVTTTCHKTLRGPRGAMIFTRRDNRGLDKLINRAIFPGMQGGPHMNKIGALAVALKEADQPEFKKYARQVVKNAKTLATELKKLGWPIVSGGTDTHLLLVDTWQQGKGISGGQASDKLEAAGIIVNKNAIPGDKRPPADPSGLRLGTAAETTRGKKEADFVKIAKQIDKILRA
ncbi:MAG: serine hydroxymethyltransferase [Patescibacteria group bacterium]